MFVFVGCAAASRRAVSHDLVTKIFTRPFGERRECAKHPRNSRAFAIVLCCTASLGTRPKRKLSRQFYAIRRWAPKNNTQNNSLCVYWNRVCAPSALCVCMRAQVRCSLMRLTSARRTTHISCDFIRRIYQRRYARTAGRWHFDAPRARRAASPPASPPPMTVTLVMMMVMMPSPTQSDVGGDDNDIGPNSHCALHTDLGSSRGGLMIM